MRQSQDYPRRLLVAVTGLSPQIVTETLYALAVEQKPPFIPTEVRLITTEEGAERATLSLLHPEDGWFHRLRADYGLPAIAFGPEHVHVLRDADGRPLGDIRTPDDNTRAADTITEVIRDLTRDLDSALHVSIAGGRKTMGFYLGYALSLYGRVQDRLSHVLVSAPYESHPQFFYPTVKSQVIYTPHPHNRPYDTREAKVTLAVIPFVRLREELPDTLLDGDVRFDDAVSAAQRAIGPTELVIDLPGRRLCAGGQVIGLSPLHLAFLAWLARRRMRGDGWLACPSEDAPEARYAAAFLAEYRAILGEMGDDERTAGRMQDEGGMTREFFSQTKSKLHRSLRTRLGRRHARPYLVSEEGSRSRRRYGLDIDPEAIRFGPVESSGGPARRAATLPFDPPGKTTGWHVPQVPSAGTRRRFPRAMADHVNRHESGKSLLDATCRVALAGLLHDLGKLAERAEMPVPNREILEVNKQIYCPNPKPYPDSPGWFSHVHAAYTALALDVLESDLPPIKGEDASPFQEWGEARAGGADDSLINAAAKHHKPETYLQWIVATADRAASGFDRERFDQYNNARDEDPTTGKNHYTARQYTLFEQIDIKRGENGGRAAPKWDYRYRLAPLSPRSIFPVRADGYETNARAAARDEYSDLWRAFREALGLIPESHRRNLSLWLDHFDSLWMTFTHAVPAATAFRTVPDVSLYDHSRVVAALAAAIWRYHHERGDDRGEIRIRLADRRDWNEPKLLFVQGDLFGIQDFIFASGGETTKHAAKLLRGRSFFVALLTECAALRVLDVLSLPPTSQIVNAAGKFQIIAPNTPKTIEALHGLREELDDWFLRHTFGQSGIGIAWTSATCNELQEGSREDSPYRKLVTRLFEALEVTKLQRFSLCGESGPPAVSEGYLESIGEHGGLCAVDGRSPADGEERDGAGLSRLACDQIRIGSLLTRKNRNRLLVTRDPLDGPNVDSLDTDIFGYHVGFTGDEEASGRFGEVAGAGNLLRVWDFSLPEEGAEEPLFHGYARRDINAWVPRFSKADLADGSRYDGVPADESGDLRVGDIKPFGHLAREARERRNGSHETGSDPELRAGVPALMTLKGDVDNLGAIFQRGLAAPSLSRMAALSRQMNAFFAIHLPHLCRTGYPNTYTVFAGGDDFFLIGPWTDQMELASRMREDFRRYVAGNPMIGFSAGLSMTKPGLPVRRFEAMAEDSLEDAKAFTRKENTAGSAATRVERTREEADKDAITCFHRTIDWSTYRALQDAHDRLRGLVADMSQGYVYGLLNLVELAESVPCHPENARWRSRFYYQTSRTLEKVGEIDGDARRQRMDRLAEEIVQCIQCFGGNYRIALFAHLYRNRK